MKKAELRQLVRELIKEAYVDSKGELKRFKTIDDEEGKGTTEWLGGLQRVVNFLRSIPKLKELGFTEPMVRIVKELEETWYYLGMGPEKSKMINQIPGDNLGQKAEMAALGMIMHGHDMIFNLHILPHLEKFNPDLPGLMDDEDDLFEELTITKFDLDTLKAVGKKLAQLGVVKEGAADIIGNGIIKIMDWAFFGIMADNEEAFNLLMDTLKDASNEEKAEMLTNLSKFLPKPTLRRLAKAELANIAARQDQLKKAFR